MKTWCLLICCLFIIILTWCGFSSLSKTIKEIETLQEAQNRREALTRVDTALVIAPHQKTLLRKKAELLFQTEAYDDFLAVRPQLSARNQKDLYRSYLVASMRAGHSAMIGKEIEQLIAKTPTSDTYQLHGQLMYLQGNIQAALESYDTALKLDPKNQDALINKAIALADAGSLYESLALLDQAITLYPDNYLLWYNKWTVLSDLWYQQRNVIWTWSFSYYGDALRHFEKAYRLNPYYQNTLIWLWITYLDLQQYKKAHQAFQTVLSSDQNAEDAWYYEAKTFAAEGKIAEAKKTYEQLLLINPEFDLAQQELMLLENQ